MKTLVLISLLMTSYNHSICLPLSNVNCMANVTTTVTKFPKNKQLYARNVATNMAEVIVEGSTTTANLQRVVLRVLRENVLIQSLDDQLVYNSGTAAFSLIYMLPSERANYSFQLYADDGNTLTLIQSASEVVAGDVYIIDGQSNAEAKMWSGSGAAYNDPFIRVFGKAVPTPLTTLQDTWFIGQGDGDRLSDGNAGQWGLVLANLLSMNTNIPIAIFNGAHGGTPINFHARNDANPSDLNTNYGRLYQRLLSTGLDTSVRGILWYQGESDGSNTQAYYETSFDALYQDWKVDYPNTEQFYTVQVRSGCGGNAFLMINIQEALRKQSSLKSDMKLMTTKGIATDGCHYPFVNGYEQLGIRMANLMLNDFYNGSNPDAEAPDIVAAMIDQNDPTKIELTLTGADALFIDVNAEIEFVVPNNTVLSATVGGTNLVVLQLASPLTNPTTITYLDSSPTTTTPYIKDSFGIGLASFKDFNVWNSTPDCHVVINENVNICHYIFANPSSTLATLDCDGGGVNNAIECANNTDPLMMTDDCPLVQTDAITIASQSSCVTPGSHVQLNIMTDGSEILPPAFQLLYILIDQVGQIISSNPLPVFNINSPGSYTVYSVAFNPSYYDVTTALSYADMSANLLCGDISLPLAITVEDCCNQDLYIPGIGISVPAAHYKRDAQITSDGLVDNTPTIFDSGTSTELLVGFEVLFGVEFGAYLDGCN